MNVWLRVAVAGVVLGVGSLGWGAGGSERSEYL